MKRKFNVVRLLALCIVLTALVEWMLLWCLPSPMPGPGPVPSSESASQEQLFQSCNQLFGRHQLVLRNISTPSATSQCLQHRLLQWLACEIGPIRIDTTKIRGSFGGELLSEVMRRNESIENLDFLPGSLRVLRDVPPVLQNSLAGGLGRFLRATQPLNYTPVGPSHHPWAVFVHRGAYANPCMAILAIYNVYIVLHYLVRPLQDIKTSNIQIIWLDGHAKANHDSVWEQVFQHKPLYIKQISSSTIGIDNAVVVNTMSAIGDEGLGKYPFSVDGLAPHFSAKGCADSTLLEFRNFVLHKYNKTAYQRFAPERPRLTLLVRNNHLPHPRSDGIVDRSFANLHDDVNYLQSLFPSHDVLPVAFEEIPFDQQLQHVIETNVWASVHGAGNIHTLFLPHHATVVEFFPKSFERRRRFRFLTECRNLTYQARRAYITEHLPAGKIKVRLRPPQ